MSKRLTVAVLLVIPVVFVLLIPGFWAVFYLGVYHGYGNYKVRGHQDFAVNGWQQIEPAKEMDQLFQDCRHFITYGANSEPLFNSVAYFRDRYELTMQVPVDIQSETSGTLSGNPQFYLNEVSVVTVSPSGQIEASFSRSLNFGSAEWQTVFEASGDFSTIGFAINTTSVPNFQQYAAACRPSN